MAPSTGPSVYVHAGDGPSAVFGPDASSVTSRGPTSRAGFIPQPDTGPVTKINKPTMEPMRNGAAGAGAANTRTGVVALLCFGGDEELGRAAAAAGAQELHVVLLGLSNNGVW